MLGGCLVSPHAVGTVLVTVPGDDRARASASARPRMKRRRRPRPRATRCHRRCRLRWRRVTVCVVRVKASLCGDLGTPRPSSRPPCPPHSGLQVLALAVQLLQVLPPGQDPLHVLGHDGGDPLHLPLQRLHAPVARRGICRDICRDPPRDFRLTMTPGRRSKFFLTISNSSRSLFWEVP